MPAKASGNQTSSALGRCQPPESRVLNSSVLGSRAVLRPANRALHQAIGAFDAPFDKVIAFDTSCTSASVQTSSHAEARAPLLVFEDVEG